MRKNDAGAKPGAAGTSDVPGSGCWAHVVAGLYRAVVPIRQDARRPHLPLSAGKYLTCSE